MSRLSRAAKLHAWLAAALVAATVPLLSVSAATAAVPAAYTIQDLSLPDSTYSIAYGINDSGQAVVHAQDPNHVYPDYGYGGYRSTDGGLVHLDASDRPWAINKSGTVVGEGSDGEGGIWAAGQTGRQSIGPGAARDIADTGWAAGLQYTSGTTVPVRISPAGAVTPLAIPADADRAQPYALNEAGVVVGNVEAFGHDDGAGGIVGDYNEAIEWDSQGNPTRIFSGGPGTSTYGLDVNEGGDVLIHVSAARNHALILNADGTSTPVPDLGGSFLEAQRMNDNRQVVGRADWADGTQTAVLYDAATDRTVDLQTLIPASSGWRLHVANDINSSGQIVGYGYRNGAIHAFLLTPGTPSSDPPGSVTATVTNGGTVTTDPTGAGASPEVPVQTTITAPSSVTGELSATAGATTGTAPTGFDFFGQQVVLDGPTASVTSPYVVTFTIDATQLVDGSGNPIAAGDVQVFRNGTAVANCSDPSSAVPDPCVALRTAAPGGDAAVTVHTSHFSTWNLGRLRYTVSNFRQPVDEPPTVNTVKSGLAVPVKFSLGGNRGLNIFVAGYPTSVAVACGAAATDAIEQTVKAGSSSLSYNKITDTYTYTWKTDKAWTGCRTLMFRFRDGTVKNAQFQLTR